MTVVRENSVVRLLKMSWYGNIGSEFVESILDASSPHIFT